MAPVLKYHNARSTAYDVKREMEERLNGKISARPWNMYEPDHTLWWLVPSTNNWPAYMHGKFFFSQDRAPENHLFCGLHIEKGLDPSVEGAYSSPAWKRMIMREDWLWHAFSKDIGSNKMVEALNRISENCHVPVIIRMEAAIAEIPGSFDPRAARPEWDLIIWSWEANGLQTIKTSTPSLILREIEKASSLIGIKQDIAQIVNSAWVWIDLFIGVQCELSTSQQTQSDYEAADLYDNVLFNLIHWFR
ncbi:MAG: hypothetical protein KKB20_01310 [Proteobacteria bacterium]|nr:hypothetical protein [Pseudomonadota bacterium]